MLQTKLLYVHPNKYYEQYAYALAHKISVYFYPKSTLKSRNTETRYNVCFVYEKLKKTQPQK